MYNSMEAKLSQKAGIDFMIMVFEPLGFRSYLFFAAMLGY